MFLLVPAHPGCPGQIPQSRKTVVLCVCYNKILFKNEQQHSTLCHLRVCINAHVKRNTFLVHYENQFCSEALPQPPVNLIKVEDKPTWCARYDNNALATEKQPLILWHTNDQLQLKCTEYTYRHWLTTTCWQTAAYFHNN